VIPFRPAQRQPVTVTTMTTTITATETSNATMALLCGRQKGGNSAGEWRQQRRRREATAGSPDSAQ